MIKNMAKVIYTDTEKGYIHVKWNESGGVRIRSPWDADRDRRVISDDNFLEGR